MSESNAFPSDVYETIALEWLKQQDLNGKSPAYVYELYKDALQEIHQSVK